MNDATAADWATLAEGNARQARKRVSADLVVRDVEGRVLIVDPNYKDGWDLPGGMVEANEPPSRAAAREVREELGVDLQPGELLLVEWFAPHGPWDDLLALIFDGGVLDAERASHLRLADHELGEFRFVSPDEARRLLRHGVGDRLERALRAAADGTTSYSERTF